MQHCVGFDSQDIVGTRKVLKSSFALSCIVCVDSLSVFILLLHTRITQRKQVFEIFCIDFSVTVNGNITNMIYIASKDCFQKMAMFSYIAGKRMYSLGFQWIVFLYEQPCRSKDV